MLDFVDMSVADLGAASCWFDENWGAYLKWIEQGKIKNVAFINYPDGYWIEIVKLGGLKSLGRSKIRPAGQIFSLSRVLKYAPTYSHGS